MEHSRIKLYFTKEIFHFAEEGEKFPALPLAKQLVNISKIIKNFVNKKKSKNPKYKIIQ